MTRFPAFGRGGTKESAELGLVAAVFKKVLWAAGEFFLKVEALCFVEVSRETAEGYFEVNTKKIIPKTASKMTKTNHFFILSLLALLRIIRRDDPNISICFRDRSCHWDNQCNPAD